MSGSFEGDRALVPRPDEHLNAWLVDLMVATAEMMGAYSWLAHIIAANSGAATEAEYYELPPPIGEIMSAQRHPATAHFEPLFAYEHLPPHLREYSKPFKDLHDRLLTILSDGPELSTALRKLVEAKDCAVRQAVIDAGRGI